MTVKKCIKPGEILKTVLIVLIVLVFMYPLFWMVTASFKQPTEFVSKPAYALNSGFYVQNYIDAWTRGHLFHIICF